MDLLTTDELIALATLARVIASIDEEVLPEEREALAAIADQVSEGERDGGSPYRDEAAQPIGRARWDALWEEAAVRYPGPEDARVAALTVVRPRTQEAIYGILYGVAMQGTITPPEWAILEWLQKTWKLPEQA